MKFHESTIRKYVSYCCERTFLEYQTKRGEEDFNPKQAEKANSSSQSEEPLGLNFSRFRNSKVRTEVLRDLSSSVSPRKSRKEIPGRQIAQTSPRRIGLSDSSMVNHPFSPSKATNIGVHIGFQLNMIVVTLKRVVDEINADSERIFLLKIRRRANRIKCAEKLDSLLKRKRLNATFHAFATLVNYSDSVDGVEEPVDDEDQVSPRSRRSMPIVLPLGATHPLATMPPYVHVTGSRLHTFAAVGRITGVLLSIIRIQKISFVNELIRLRFDKLYFIRSLS